MTRPNNGPCLGGVATVLPVDARNALVAASKVASTPSDPLRKQKAIEGATSWVKFKYSGMFRK